MTPTRITLPLNNSLPSSNIASTIKQFKWTINTALIISLAINIIVELIVRPEKERAHQVGLQR